MSDHRKNSKTLIFENGSDNRTCTGQPLGNLGAGESSFAVAAAEDVSTEGIDGAAGDAAPGVDSHVAWRLLVFVDRTDGYHG